MAMTLGQALVHAEQLEVHGVISKTAQALIRLKQEYREVVGAEKYEQIIEEAGLAHPDTR
ncbi:hypothetical protein E1N52_04290 [Paraburkholderia guartelaensis]|uniref:Uncharacterized protein n=1 Tax=Paraburkholderia guartelaensis TaxID=2546446 RepID=A0A4R5LLB1_9BURK|nr:hypothetical protein [Paraburkholderia guartelaensis]TDG10569.1 hypothetical protein E1N52_04290 [Paraburkholderia guartelaensis]